MSVPAGSASLPPSAAGGLPQACQSKFESRRTKKSALPKKMGLQSAFYDGTGTAPRAGPGQTKNGEAGQHLSGEKGCHSQAGPLSLGFTGPLTAVDTLASFQEGPIPQPSLERGCTPTVCVPKGKGETSSPPSQRTPIQLASWGPIFFGRCLVGKRNSGFERHIPPQASTRAGSSMVKFSE